ITNGMVDEDSLDRDAGLAGVTESTSRTTLGREVQIRVRFHNHTAIASYSHPPLLFPSLFLHHPPHCSVSEKPQQLKGGVDEKPPPPPIVTGEHVQTTGRPPGLHRHFT